MQSKLATRFLLGAPRRVDGCNILEMENRPNQENNDKQFWHVHSVIQFVCMHCRQSEAYQSEAYQSPVVVVVVMMIRLDNAYKHLDVIGIGDILNTRKRPWVVPSYTQKSDANQKKLRVHAQEHFPQRS